MQTRCLYKLPYNHYHPLASAKDAWNTTRGFYIELKFKIMEIIGISVMFYLFLLGIIFELKKQIKDMKTSLKSMNHDLNVVSKTMENMHKREKAKELCKQILKG